MGKKRFHLIIDDVLFGDLNMLYQSSLGQRTQDRRGRFHRQVSMSEYLERIIYKELNTEENRFKLAMIKKRQLGIEPEDWSKL